MQPWLRLLDQPGLARSVLISLGSGLGGTVLALGAAILIAAAAGERIVVGARGLLLPALLAVPHLASAVGTSFLLAPSGWIVRAFSPWLTAWQRPPDLATVNDPWGLALTFGLALREAPFLLLALAAARPQVATARILAVGANVRLWTDRGLAQAGASTPLPTDPAAALRGPGVRPLRRRHGDSPGAVSATGAGGWRSAG